AVLGFPMVLVLLAVAPWICMGILEDQQYVLGLQINIAAAWFGMLCEVGLTYLRMRYQAKQFVVITTFQLVAALALNIYFIVFLKLGILGIFYSTLITQGTTGLLLAALILRGTGLQVSLPLLRRLIAFG